MDRLSKFSMLFKTAKDIDRIPLVQSDNKDEDATPGLDNEGGKW